MAGGSIDHARPRHQRLELRLATFAGDFMNRSPFAALVLALLSTGSAAQVTPPSVVIQKEQAAATCAECGVIRSVKRIESNQRLTPEERKSTAGYVASVPLDGGKPVVGSATDVRRELKPATVRHEIVVRLDDGRFQVVMQDDAENLREGDKVRVDRGKVVLRDK
jgi:hypothetical protein